MNDCVDGGNNNNGANKMSSAGGCGVLPTPPPPYSQMMMMNAAGMAPPPPPYWSHQQAQQQQMAQNSVANSQQLMEMPPATSNNVQNFPSGFSQTDFNQQTAFNNGMNSNSPAAFFQQQQFQEFQKFPMNVSPGGAGQFGGNGTNNGLGQMSGAPQQQISSPSVTSTADLVQQNPGGGGGGNFLHGNNQMMLPQFGFQHQQPPQQSFLPPNGFPAGLPNNNSHSSESEINSTQLGGQQCDSPMLNNNRQFGHTAAGQTNFPSPIAGGQPQQLQRWPIPPQMGMLPQFQHFNNQIGNGNASPRFPMLPGVMGQQMMGPPQMFIHGAAGPGLVRRSFLFTTDMANKAVLDLQQQQAFDMAQWHLTRMAQYHQQNPSTSRASFEQQQQMLQSQQQTAAAVNNVGRSPTAAPQSRSTKRKASVQTTTPQEQQHQQQQPQQSHNSMNSPSIVPSQNSFGQPQSVPILIEGQQQQQRHSSIDICDSSTNGDIFKRPPSRMPNGSMPNCYISPNPGQQPNNCFGRMDDENPLKKMEIMTSKTLNEQPAIKMQRLGGMDVADEQQQQMQKELNGLSTQEKLRKLQELEKMISHMDNNNSPSMGQVPQGLIHQMHQQQQQQNGGFCPIPPGAGPPMTHSIPPSTFPSDQMLPQFRPSPFFPGQMMPNTQDGGGIAPHHHHHQQQQQQQLGHMPTMPPIASMPENSSSSSPSSVAQFYHFPHQRFPAPLRMASQNGLIQKQHPPPFFGGPAEQNGQIGADFPGSNNMWMPDGGPPSHSSMESMKMATNPQQNHQQQMMTTTNGGSAQMQ